MSKYRDEDGFIILKPKHPLKKRNGKLVHTPQNVSRKCVGEKSLISSPETEKPSAKSSSYTPSSASVLSVEYHAKTWQRKAWQLVAGKIDWHEKSPFRKLSGSRKLKHIKCLAVMLKIRPLGPGPKQVIAELTLDDDNMYRVATTVGEFRQLMNDWKAMFNNVNLYLEDARTQGFSTLTYISKVLIVYDDASYDAWVGYPAKLDEHLGVEFDRKGQVILNER